MKEKYTLTDNLEEQRYEIEVDGHKAYVEYILQPRAVILPHTFVPQPLEGRGIGSGLVEAVLTEVKGKGLQVVPQCDFIAKYILRHPEWEEIVYRETVIK